MLKSFILKPTDDILSYREHKEFPYNVLPKLLLVYGKNNIVELDEKELAILYNQNNSYDYVNNIITIRFFPIKKPKYLLTKENTNLIKLKKNKYNKVKKILPFCNDVKNIINNYIIDENLEWKIKTKRTFTINPLIVNKYTVTNETKISITKLQNAGKKIAEKSKIFYARDLLENPPRYIGRNLKLDKIIYGIFNNNSYIPSKITTITVNSSDKKNIIIQKDEVIKILLFMKRKVPYQTESEEDEEHNFFTEDLEYGNIYI